MQIPRLYNKKESKTESLESYQKLKEVSSPTDELIKKIIFGISQKNYSEVSRLTAESFGLSQSSISKSFVEESKKLLSEFEERDLGKYDFVGLAIDGKYLRKQQVVIALGITMEGIKLPIGFIETTTENSESIKGLLQDLIRRNFRFKEGIFVMVDGAQGLSKAVKSTFGEYALIQRCQWHKRENVISYLPEKEKELFKRKLRRAYNEPNYEEAKRKLYETRIELEKVNRNAAKSLDEGLEETLTLHRLGLVEELGKSFTTTNIIENLNSQLSSYLRKVKYYSTPDMRARWVAVSLIQIENRMRRINNYDKLYLLRKALKTELKLCNEMVA
jgi:transposase-like protein